MRKVSGVEMLAHLMDAKGVTQTNLSQGAGTAALDRLGDPGGKRKLNVKHITVLAKFFKVTRGCSSTRSEEHG